MEKLVEAAVLALEAGLRLWGTKEARKYQDRLIELKRKYYEEKNKADPNMAVLDYYRHELFLLSHAFAAAAPRGPDPSPSS